MRWRACSICAKARSSAIYATRAVLGVLDGQQHFQGAEPGAGGAPRADARRGGRSDRRATARRSGLRVTPFSVPGKPALYLEGRGYRRPSRRAVRKHDRPRTDRRLATGRKFFFIPGCAAIDAALTARLTGAALLFFDGTLWHDDEMIRAGLGTKTGKRMGHVSVADATAPSPRWPIPASRAKSSSTSTTPTRCTAPTAPNMRRRARPAGKSGATGWS